MSCLEHDAAREVVARALAEDLGERGDVTTEALIPAGATARARVVARQEGVVAGTLAAEEAFRQVDEGLVVHWAKEDGEAVARGDGIAAVEGSLRSILAAERTALNLLGHLSGVATLTRRFVEAAGPGVTILDTRKTTPGLRVLEKAAVRAGGGANHRMGLHDAVLVKDNHLAHVDIHEAVKLAREHAPGLLVEVECDTLVQVAEAVEVGADRILLDNMTPAQVAEAVRRVADGGGVRSEVAGGWDERAKRASVERRTPPPSATQVEVSGGVTLDNVADYAAAGPDFVSVGALTHSAPALDVSLDL